MRTELIEIVHGRANPGIDPTLHIWGWEVPVYLFLGGIVAGLMILLPLLEVHRNKKAESTAAQLMPFGAIILLSLGMGALFLDLAHKLYVWRFYLAMNPMSPMSWGSWLLILVYPALILQGLGGLNDRWRAEVRKLPIIGGFTTLIDMAFNIADTHRRLILWVTMAMGAGLGIYTGLLLGSSVSRLAWNSAVLGPLFLTSGLSTGAAFLLLFELEDDLKHDVVKIDITAIVIEMMLIGVLMIGYVTGGGSARAGGSFLLGGPYTAQFWGLVVTLGLITPLALNLLEVKRRLPATLMTPILVLVGGFALRAVLVAAGQSISFGDF